MSIVKMQKLQLIGMRSDTEALFDVLQKMGCLQVTQTVADTGDGVFSALSSPDSSGLDDARELQSILKHAMKALDVYAPEKSGLFYKREEISLKRFLNSEGFERAADDAKTIADLDDKIEENKAEIERLKNKMAAFVPWLGLDFPLECTGTKYVRFQLGTLPADAEKQLVLDALGDLGMFTEVTEDTDYRYHLLTYHVSCEEELMSKLKPLGWARYPFAGAEGTARENYDSIEEDIADIRSETEELAKKIASYAGRRNALRCAIDRTDAAELCESSKAMALDTAKAFILSAWVRESDIEALKPVLDSFSCAYEFSVPDESEYDDVPVELKSNKLTKPLNMVTEMYSLPRYGSVDPNPLMMPFFVLFYGIMMADMGYGILMFLAGTIINKKYKPLGTMGHMFGLLQMCGISTFVFGVLTGGFFGDFLTQFIMLTSGKEFTIPALISPIEDTLAILIGSMALGFVHIVTGMAIGAINKIRSGKLLDAVFNEFTWWIIFAGIALAVLGITKIVLFAGAAMVIAGSLILNKGAGKITGIFSSLYSNVTGYFGDILSYSRLMALMLAGSVIAQVFNTLGAITGSAIAFLLISMFGNALNFGLNLLGCYVHDLRLQCLEYFNKFYIDGGKAFKAMSYKTKYVELTDK